jgi:chaperonin cofactor prefoldin
VAIREDRSVQLGCGTLLIILLIVAFFGNRGLDDLEDRLTALDAKVDALQREVRGLRASVEKLREEVRKGR